MMMIDAPLLLALAALATGMSTLVWSFRRKP